VFASSLGSKEFSKRSHQYEECGRRFIAGPADYFASALIFVSVAPSSSASDVRRDLNVSTMFSPASARLNFRLGLKRGVQVWFGRLVKYYA